MRKTDDNVILQMLREGKTQKQIAEHFNVSGAAICKRVKKIKQAGKIERHLQGLTPKEQKFCLEVAAGKTKTQAALNSYECSSRDSAKSLGTQLAKRDDINIAISQILEDEGIGRRHRIRVLKRHVDNELDSHASLKGIDIANKMEGIYVEKQIRVEATYEDLKQGLAEIEAKRVRLEASLKEDLMSELKELHPEMDDEKISEMAEKTFATMFPESEKTRQLKAELGLGEDAVEGEIIENESG